MRRWAIALVLSGCAAPTLEPGRYSCSRDAGEEEPGQEQCPDNYRCGLEGYCHRLGDVSIAWRCEDDDDCENGYHCGLAADRRTRECQDSEKPGAFACAVDGDCVPPWRCGLEQVCHPRGVAAAYACVADGGMPDDGWCELGWRCAASGACVDPSEDALRPFTPPPFPPGDFTLLAPSVGPIERFSTSRVFSGGLGGGEQTIATVENGRLIARLIDRRGERPPVRYDLGPAPANFVAHGSRGESGFTLVIPDAVPRVFTASDAGALTLFELQPDGGATAFPIPSVEVFRFSQGSAAAGLAPRTVAFQSDPTSGVFIAASGAVGLWVSDYSVAAGLAFGSVPGNRVVDLTTLRATLNDEVAFAIDRRGLWLSGRSLGSDCFLPLVVQPLSTLCPGAGTATHVPQRLRPLGIDDLAVSSELADGGSEFVTLLDTSLVWTRSRTCATSMDPCGADFVPVPISLGPCRACPSGRLLDFALLEGAPHPRIELACGSADGGSVEHFALTAGNGAVPTCTRVLLDGEPALFSTPNLRAAEQATPGLIAWSDGARHVWSGQTAATSLSLTLDRVPQVVARREGSAGPFAMTERITARAEPGLGLFEEPGIGAVSGVTGKPSWVVLRDGQVLDVGTAARAQEGALIAKVGPTVLDAPVTSVEAPTATGRRALIVTTGFTLLAGEVAAPAIGSVSPRHTSRAQLRSISFPRPARGAYLEGFAVAGNAVLRLSASAVGQWLETTVGLPAALVPLEVWHDLERGRVGFTDGTVLSLPSRVALAPPIGAEVLDYVQVCGQQLALTATALHRLEPVAGATVGRWAKLPLPSGFAEGGFVGGRAAGLGDELYLFTRDGSVARWQFAPCP